MKKTNAAAGHLISRRFLASTQKSPALEILETKAKAKLECTPIVCLHGASGGAWMWQDYLKVLAERGRYALALSLRGHGNSDGYENIPATTLDDYADDLRRVFAEFAEPPVLIAHSLGALLAQRLLGRDRMRAAVLMAPLPPEGMGLLSARLLATMPTGWFDAAKMILGFTPPVVGPIKDLIFSDRLVASEIDDLMAQMVAESARVLTEAHLPHPIMPAFLAGVPTLTIAGELDRLVPREFVRRTAIYHGGDYFEAKGLGHLLHAEPKTQDIAHTTVDWLEGKGI
jgi:pimeloyl-ACP methyl ester carboxylesterase